MMILELLSILRALDSSVDWVQGQAGEGEQVFATLEDGNGLLVQIAVQVASVDLGGLSGQGESTQTREVGDDLDQALVLISRRK